MIVKIVGFFVCHFIHPKHIFLKEKVQALLTLLFLYSVFCLNVYSSYLKYQARGPESARQRLQSGPPEGFGKCKGVNRI